MMMRSDGVQVRDHRVASMAESQPMHDPMPWSRHVQLTLSCPRCNLRLSSCLCLRHARYARVHTKYTTKVCRVELAGRGTRLTDALSRVPNAMCSSGCGSPTWDWECTPPLLDLL